MLWINGGLLALGAPTTDGAFCEEWLGRHAVGKSAIEAGADLPRLVCVGMCQEPTHAAQQNARTDRYASFSNLIGAGEECGWQRYAYRLYSFEVDDQFEFR
jgi:hypothetical protein